MAGWSSAERILEKEAGNFHEMENYGPSEDEKVNNALWGSQLTGLQNKLIQGNGKYSSGRSKKITEQEMTGVRKEIPKS